MKEQGLRDIERRIGRRRDERSSGLSVWHAIGGITLLGLAAMIIVNLPDIKRYIRISTM